jgi:hypothetical protein
MMLSHDETLKLSTEGIDNLHNIRQTIKHAKIAKK